MPNCNHKYLYLTSTTVYNGKLKYQCYHCKKTKIEIKDYKLYISSIFTNIKISFITYLNKKKNYVLF